MNPRTVTFDCWSTLLYEPEPLRTFEPRVRAVAHAAKSAGKPVDDETARLALDAAWRRHSALWNNGQGSTAQDIANWALQELGIPDPGVALGLGAALGEASLGSHVLALDGAVETLARLAGEGVRTALICDTGFTPGRIIRVLLERVGLLEHLEVCIFSDEVGVPKAAPAHVRGRARAARIPAPTSPSTWATCAAPTSQAPAGPACAPYACAGTTTTTPSTPRPTRWRTRTRTCSRSWVTGAGEQCLVRRRQQVARRDAQLLHQPVDLAAAAPLRRRGCRRRPPRARGSCRAASRGRDGCARSRTGRSRAACRRHGGRRGSPQAAPSELAGSSTGITR